MPREDKIFRNYFVDEAGDDVIFNKHGQPIIGTEGCSRFFMLGLLDIANPDKLQADFDELRRDLLADSWFKNIPSMQPRNKKTALLFHAKDDIPEVRREVFRLIINQVGIKFSAIIRDKKGVLEEITKTGIRYHQNTLYDSLVSNLINKKLLQHDKNHITFAKRGNADRTKALKQALSQLNQAAPSDENSILMVQSQQSHNNANLQAVDYLIWALQRLYEKREDRYMVYIWDICQSIYDVDDTRLYHNGVYYDAKNPISLSVLKSL